MKNLLKFQVLHKRSSVLYVAVSKCILLLFYFFHYYFDLKLFTQSERVRVTFFEIPGAPKQDQCYSIFPGAPCIQGAFLQNIQRPDSRIFILICQVKVIYFLILGASRKKKRYCFFRGPPCIQQFQNAQCLDSIFFILISHYSPKMLL